MTKDHEAAILAAIEQKIIESDRRINEARKIFQHYVFQLQKEHSRADVYQLQSRPDEAAAGGGNTTNDEEYITETECLE